MTSSTDSRCCGRRPDFYAARARRPYLPAEQIPGPPFVHRGGDGPRRQAPRDDPIEFRHGDSRDPLHRPGLPLGLLRDAGDHGAALALSRPARLAPRDDRAARRHRHASASGYTPGRQAAGSRRFRDRYGMPFAAAPRARLVATGRACRAVVATRLRIRAASSRRCGRSPSPGSTRRCCSTRTPRSPPRSRASTAIDAAAVVAALDSPAVSEAYEADKAEARSAAGGPTDFQGKAAVSDGLVRYTAPSVVFEADGRRLEAGGFQPLEAYDVLLANLDPTLRARRAAGGPARAARALQRGAVHAGGRGPARRQPDRRRPRRAPRTRCWRSSRTGARAHALGDDAIWRAAEPPLLAAPSAPRLN